MAQYRKRQEYKTKEYEKKYRNKLRLEVLIKYGGNPPKCACCKESIIEFLTIDHIKTNGAIHRKKLGGIRFYVMLRNQPYQPHEYQVLCYNCNCVRKDAATICPHKKICVS